jgi:hypothetical protein
MKPVSSEIRWRAVVSICAVAAVVQNLLVAGRILHILRLMWKVDSAAAAITAGSTTLIVFFGATLGCALLACLARARLPTGDIFRRISSGSMLALAIGAFVWGGLVCSPLVVYVNR